MSGEKSKKMPAPYSKATRAALAEPSTVDARRIALSNQRIVQNFILVWLDSGIIESNVDCQNSITQLRQIVNIINLFTDADQCIDFLSEIHDERAFMIVSGSLGENIVPCIHDMQQLNSIYVFCDHKPRHELWVKEWSKVKGVFIEIDRICESLKEATRQCDRDSIAFSLISTDDAANKNLDQLDQSFMYTKLLKEITLETEFGEQTIREFADYCREYNAGALQNINKFERDYRNYIPVWWYTYPCFLYSMLNRALRTLEVDTIMKMAFFIKDLHRNIEQLHSQQASKSERIPFTVYRGQFMSTSDFEKFLKTKGGLLSFNNFLSTSEERDVSLTFAQGDPEGVGILFVMTIDPSISSAPFAFIGKVGYFQSEEEILFSMHTVFRIGDIKQINGNERLWQVNLKLTADDDELLGVLTKRMREEIKGSTAWHRMGSLLVKIGQFDKAEEVYRVLLDLALEERQKGDIYSQLGHIKDQLGDYAEAASFFDKTLKIQLGTRPPNLRDIAISYSDIGQVYSNMGEYWKALSVFEMALGLNLKANRSNDLPLGSSYINIASVYVRMKEYSQALLFYEKSVQIFQKILPPNHPDLATCYGNIGSVYKETEEYSKAVLFYEKSMQIFQKTLPPNHPHLATLHNNIGSMHGQMGEYSKALSSHEKALEIRQKSLPPNHPHLATSYGNIASVYTKIGEHSKAVVFYEKALEIQQKTLPRNHPDLASSYHNIGSVYKEIAEHSKAVSFYEKALEIHQKTLPPNHTDLAVYYSNIALVYVTMGEYSKALSFFEKDIEISEKTSSPDHTNLATSYNNIGLVYYKMGEYSKALSFHEKALETRQKVLDSLNNPELAASYNCIAVVYDKMGEYSKALPLYQKANEIYKKILPPNHSNIKITQNRIEIVRSEIVNNC